MAQVNVYAKAYELLQFAGADLAHYLEVRAELRTLGELDASAVVSAQRDWDAANKPLAAKVVDSLVIFDGPFGWS